MAGEPARVNPVDAVATLVDHTLTVAHVVGGPLWVVDPSERASVALALMQARNFDVAGVGQDGAVTHLVCRSDLADRARGAVKASASPILAGHCVEKSLPLSHLFEKLRHREFLFVLDDGEVRHVVTRADLQAPAIGVVLLAFLTLIETGLRRIVAGAVRDSLLELLPEARRQKVEELYEKKREDNVAIGYEDCLYFSDWLELAGVSGSWKVLGYSSKKAFHRDTSSFAEVRNALAHGGSVLDASVHPLKALDRIERIRRFTVCVWDAAAEQQDDDDVFLSSIIRLPRDGEVLAGPSAVESLPGPTPAHVITAWNPGGSQRSRLENRKANKGLREVLIGSGAKPKPRLVIGESVDGRWREESYLVTGLSREALVDLGRRFGQATILELDEDSTHVIRCEDGQVVRSGPRVLEHS